MEYITGFGGAKLAVHRMGAGRPLLLVHGLFSNANVNWIKYGHAALLANSGFEVIMPDLRAHGQSDAPHDPAAYPTGVLVEDVKALVRELGLHDYDMGGFSLGSRTSVKAVLDGLNPRRLILGGMGVTGLTGWAKRSAFFINAIDRYDHIQRGDPDYIAQQFMKTLQIDRVAARLLLQSVDDTPLSRLADITMPCLVLCGDEDQDNGSASDLAATLPDGRYVSVPGTHMSSVIKRQLGEEMVRFLLS